ncbi:MAG: hypothetical protein EOO01_43695, partial [Chitinophagaceae bacterium]
MKLKLPRSMQVLTCLFLFFFVGLLYSCVKHDPPHHSAGADSEDAYVVHDWYKLIARIQLHSNPQPPVLKNFRDFAFIGVGLYEAVQPGIQ